MGATYTIWRCIVQLCAESYLNNHKEPHRTHHKSNRYLRFAAVHLRSCVRRCMRVQMKWIAFTLYRTHVDFGFSTAEEPVCVMFSSHLCIVLFCMLRMDYNTKHAHNDRLGVYAILQYESTIQLAWQKYGALLCMNCPLSIVNAWWP